jgi:hypothetical protein
MNVIYSGGNIRGQTMDMIASILNDVYNIRKIVKEFMKILKGGQPTKLEMAIGAYERKAFASQK